MGSGPAARDVFVAANGLRHHLIVRGVPGTPPVVLLHGLSQQAHVFDGVASRLASRFHTYCLDVRGRGETEWGRPEDYTFETYVADLDAVRSALGLDRVAVVGTSMGGLIGMLYAAQHPDHVSRLVLNDIGPEIDPAGLARVMKMLAGAPEGFPDLKSVVRYYREENAPVLGRRSDDEILEYARWHVRLNDNGVYVWKMDPAVRRPRPGGPEPDLWRAFRSIPCPLLVIRGAASDMLTRAGAERMARERPGAKLAEVPGVGHAPALTEADATRALDDFLGA